MISLTENSRGSDTYSTTGSGNKSRTFNYHLLRHLNVGAICVWNGFIVTGTCASDPSFPGELMLWTDDGHLICSEPVKHSVSTICVWGDVLITGSFKRLIFWKLKKSVHDAKIKRIKEDKVCVHSVVFWEDAVFAECSEDSRYCIKVWNPKGKLSHTQYHSAIFNHMIVFRNYLWTAGEDATIRIWKRTGVGYQIQSIKNFQGHKTGILYLTSWGNNRMVSASSDNTILVWNPKGEITHTFELETAPICIAEWVGKLVCVTKKQPDKPVTVTLWNSNGSLFQKIWVNTSSTKAILVHNDKLWQGSEGYLSVWMDPSCWKQVRLLWIAWMKNKPAECYLALLPKELLLLVISFL